MFHHSKEMFNPGANLRFNAISLTRFLRQRMMTPTALVGKVFGLWRCFLLFYNSGEDYKPVILINARLYVEGRQAWPIPEFSQYLIQNGVPKGIRTPVVAVKGRCPRPLDDGDGGCPAN